MDSGVPAAVGFANSVAQYWAVCSSTGDYTQPHTHLNGSAGPGIYFRTNIGQRLNPV
ncbi:MAG TPA: hypothetical protein VGD84_10920 [Pseudonocardiaceae bacterium]